MVRRPELNKGPHSKVDNGLEANLSPPANLSLLLHRTEICAQHELGFSSSRQTREGADEVEV